MPVFWSSAATSRSGLHDWKTCILTGALICILINIEAALGDEDLQPPSPYTASNLTSYLVTIQLGGPEAAANLDLLACTNTVVTKELACLEGNCRVVEAANITQCLDGAPTPAPVSDIYFSPNQDVSALAAYLKQVPQSTYTGQPDFSQIASVYAGNSTSGTSKSSLAGRRLQSNVAPTGQPDSAEPPVGSCSSKSEMTIYFAFPKSTDDAQWNKTLALFSSGIFLAKMQASHFDLESVEFLSFQASGDSPAPTGSGPVKSFPDAGDFPGPKPAISSNDTTAFAFSLNLLGEDAQVTNDSVLAVLYRMVSQPAPAPGSIWLSPSNMIITSIVQNDLVTTGGAPEPLGRRMLQSPAPDELYKCNSSVTQPSLTTTFRLLAIPKQDLRRIQAAISTMVVSGELLTGIQAANFRICAVTVTNFDLLPAPLPPPPAEAPSASPNIYSSRQSSRHSVVLITTSIAVPVSVVFTSLAITALWWYRRRVRRGKELVVGKLNGQDSAFEKQGFLSSRDPKYSDKPEASAQSMLRQPQQSSFSKNNLLDMPWSDWKIDPSELSIIARPDGSEWLLGSGASGRVFKALRNGVQIVAVKVFREEMTRGAITSLSSSYHAAQFRQEISILKSCHDKNIVQFVGACLTTGHSILVTEYLENGDLYKAINSQQGNRYHWYRMQLPDGKPLPNSGMARRVALDVARGLHFLHTKKIVHFDLKSANILLARDFTAKIADVGLARILHDDVLSTRREVGTFAWAAPEVLLGQRITEAADIYSFGVLLHELSAVESPRQRLLRKLTIPDELPVEIGDLIDRCLDLDPLQRPTARDLVAVLSCLPATPPFAPGLQNARSDDLGFMIVQPNRE